MQYSEIMIRYGELSTKGKNKKDFIRKLRSHVQSAISVFPKANVKSNHDRMYIELNGEDYEGVKEKLVSIFGIQSFSPVLQVDKDMDAIEQAVVQMVKDLYISGKTFKIGTRRADKDFPLDTMEINREVGAAVIQSLPEIEVKMKNPDIMVNIEVRKHGVFLYTHKVKGAAGFPVGTGGKAMLMLSGGIDSPVAGYLTLKKGVEIEAVHFYSPPYTSPQALDKAKDLTAKLAKYAGSIHFISVPFTEIQEEIKNKTPDSYSMTLNRRFMMRITDRLREERKALAIVTGESIGQVASQTLESMVAINQVTNSPVLRPLVSMDKTEIIDLSKKIDSYELSIQPYEDCCTVFAPQRPATKPNLDEALRLEEKLDVDTLVQRAIAGIKIEKIKVEDSTEHQVSDMFADLL